MNNEHEIKFNDTLIQTEEHDKKMMVEWNHTESDYPKDKTINELFEEEAKKNPGAIAVIFENKRLSYQELNEKANKLARFIRAQYLRYTNKELKSDTLIALCLDDSLETIVAMLAILKAGGAYVPIDPHNPDERIKFVIEDIKPHLIITQEFLQLRLEKCIEQSQSIPRNKLVHLISINDSYIQDLLDLLPHHDLNKICQPKDLAYVIYTSGTTGIPKGVMVEQRGVVSLIKNVNYIEINAEDVFIQLSNIAFDAATFEIWGALLNGAKLVIPKNKKNYISTLKLFKDSLKKNHVSILWLTKTLFDQYYLLEKNIFQGIKYLLIGGEALNKNLILKLINSNTAPKNIINGYGPTENTTFSCALNIKKENIINSDSVPIGSPLSNRKAYILNTDLTPLPIGEVGELHVGGAGLARGYLNRLEITAEKFIQNPFATELDKVNGNTRLYKTGDLAKWLPDGNIEYIGRNDFQIKIRGFRIELGEIENVLIKFKGIKQVTVLVKERINSAVTNKFLVAYYVGEPKSPITQENILSYLNENLPEYMIPSVFLELEAFPLTTNGKLDRNALPSPEFNNKSSYYVKSNSKLEKQLCDIWQRILGLEQIGVDDDFFRLGGNSLLAALVLISINQKFNTQLMADVLFKNPTIRQVSTFLQKNIQSKLLPIQAASKSKYYPLSSHQESIWLHQTLSPEQPIYNELVKIIICHHIKTKILQQALNELIKRHDILRAQIDVVDGVFKQIIVDFQPVNLPFEDIRYLPENQRSKRAEKLAVSLGKKAFKEREPLYAFKLIQLHNNEFQLMLILHHVIFDGMSLSQIIAPKLESYYNCLLNNGVLPDDQIKIQFVDYAVWEKQFLAENTLEDDSQYWTKKLDNLTPLNLYTKCPRFLASSFKGTQQFLEISQSTLLGAKELSKKQNVTLFTVLLSVFNFLLYRYTGQTDIAVGTVIDRRDQNVLRDVIGDFLNTLIIRSEFSDNISFLELLHTVKETTIEAYTHQILPFQKVLTLIGKSGQSYGFMPFQAAFILEPDLYSTSSSWRAEPLIADLGCTKFDLTFELHIQSNGILCRVEYNTDLFEDSYIRQMIEHYHSLLKDVIKDSEQFINAKSFLSEAERQKLIYDYNQTDRKYPSEKTIQGLFEEQVKRTPNNLAVVYKNKKLTYYELNRKANQLAHYLRIKYIEITKEEMLPDTLIGICAERSLEMIIGILGILKAGGAYIPLDPDYPNERLQFMIEDSGLNLLLTQKKLLNNISTLHSNRISNVLSLDGVLTAINDLSESNPKLITKSSNLAYVIYTSGSVGKPKGVMVVHQGVVRLIKDTNYIDIKSTDSIGHAASCTFDAATFEIWGGLLNGAAVYVVSKEDLSSSSTLIKFLSGNHITILWLTAGLFNQFVAADEKIFASLNYLLIGGEALNPTYVSIVANDLNKRPKYFLNGYGPTENVTFTTTFDILSVNYGQKNIPIGKPIANTKIYILDKNQHAVPVGVIGEMYVGGYGLARGYLNRPELTAERFILNPFATEQDQAKGYTRLYKTGDLVRWLPDGNIEYIGRNDFQVKIRGYRIELGEIEHALSTYPGVQQCAVIAKVHKTREGLSSSHQYLVSYYVSDTRLNETKLLSHLSHQLPEYMLPSVLVHLEKLPLTINGKLDRRALPEPELNDRENYVAPRNELEQKLCAIWQEVLGLASGTVGVQDDFFRLGGDSILSILLNSKLSKLGLCISIKDIFEHRTIEHLTKLLETPHESPSVQTEQGILVGRFNLLPIQQWFFEQVARGDIKNPQHWNQSFLVKIPQLELDKLQQIITALLKQHDILRANYSKEPDGYYVQTYNTHIAVPEVQLLDINKITCQKEFSQKLTNWQSDFNIEKGPLWKMGYINGYSDQTARLYFAFHHLMMDAVSWRILIEDIKLLCQNESLPSKTSSYRQWVKLINDYASEHAEEYAYWLGVQHNQQDYKRYAQQETQTFHIELDRKATAALLSQANKAYQTEINDLLLTALGYALQAWNRCSVNHITLEGHGREHIRSDIDLSRTVGWFTTAYPVKLELQASLNQSIKYIKETLRVIPNKGLGYGALISYCPPNLPKISFNYLGQFDNAEGMWQIVEETSGRTVALENQETNVINMNGMIIGGKLKFSLITKLTPQETQILADKFKYHLEEIVQHCLEKVNKKQVEYTQSDFKDYEPYVVFNTNIAPSLFIFPPGGGGAESYFNNLVPQLSKKHLVLFNNFYWFLSKKMGDSAVQHYTYELLASEYIAVMKRIQPVGPYYLLGWSFGGVLAFEVARQLCLSGEKVHKLILIDSYFDQREVMRQLSQEHGVRVNKEDINYKYCPKNTIFNDDAVVILYKTIQPPKIPENHNDIKNEREFREWILLGRYYADNRKDNGIHSVLKKNTVNIIPIESDHQNCLSNSDIGKSIVCEMV